MIPSLLNKADEQGEGNDTTHEQYPKAADDCCNDIYHISAVTTFHTDRTPLSMVMGYAGQLESSCNLSITEQKKASVIVKQSKRMKDLINDLNLASKLEYDMQPLMKKQENAVAIVRQVVVDFTL